MWLLVLVLAGCGGGRSDGRLTPSREAAFARPLDVYRQLGFLVGPEQFPVVGRLHVLAGPADSSLAVFAMSLPNSALRFQRDGAGFLGEYTVTLVFLQDSVEVRRVERREAVRVATFAETGRTDESVVFQEVIALAPGRYEVEVEARDALGSRGLRASETLEVPAFGSLARRLAQPLFIYEGVGRGEAGARPELILNPRQTVPYGGESPRLYLEAYAFEGRHEVPVRVLDPEGQERWSTRVVLDAGGGGIGQAIVEIPSDSLPLGRLWVELAGDSTLRSPLLVTISDQWMVANFEEVLQFLAFIAEPAELDSLRSAVGSAQREQWDRFWRRRDPLPATPTNEFRDEFFERVRFATFQFAEAGRPGWQTDRGEVYIVLGPPSQVLDRTVGRDAQTQGLPNAVTWLYDAGPGRLELLFVDRTGFGRYELTTESQSAFRAAARRLRQRG
jgi:GWxTD domain-containing protein